MKKRITFLFAMFAALVTTAMAQISVSPLAIANGNAELTINFKNEQVVKGIQFTLKLDLPAGVTVKTLKEEGEVAITYDGNQTYTPGNGLKVSTTNRTDGWWVLGNKVSETEDIYKFVLIDPKVEGLKAGEGAIMKINFGVVGDVDLSKINNGITLSDIHESIANSSEDFTPQANTTTDLVVNDFIIGDVDGNGQIGPNDAVWILEKIVNITNTGFVEKAADVDGNGQIGPNDAVWVLERLAHLRTWARGNSTEDGTDQNLPDPE